MRKILIRNRAIAVSLLIFIWACSNDRLQPLESPSDVMFKTLDYSELLESLVGGAQKFTITSEEDLPKITKKGTELWIDRSNLLDDSDKNPDYPYDIELIELYSLKDMLLYQKPTTSYSELLATGGAFHLKVTKNGKTYRSDIWNPPYIIIPSKKTDAGMTVFYTSLIDKGFTWIQVTSEKTKEQLIEIGRNGYQIFPEQLGWINCDRFLDWPGPLTTVSFNSEIPTIEKMLIFMVFPEINSVVQVWEGKSLKVPVGEQVRVVVTAESVDGNLYSFIKNTKVDKDMKVTVTLKKTSKDAFLKDLGDLEIK